MLLLLPRTSLRALYMKQFYFFPVKGNTGGPSVLNTVMDVTKPERKQDREEKISRAVAALVAAPSSLATDNTVQYS